MPSAGLFGNRLSDVGGKSQQESDVAGQGLDPRDHDSRFLIIPRTVSPDMECWGNPVSHLKGVPLGGLMIHGCLHGLFLDSLGGGTFPDCHSHLVHVLI